MKQVEKSVNTVPGTCSMHVIYQSLCFYLSHQNTILQSGTGGQLENRSYGACICLLKNLQALNIESLGPEVTSVTYLSHSLHFSNKESLSKQASMASQFCLTCSVPQNESNTLDTLIQFRNPLSYRPLFSAFTSFAFKYETNFI